MLSRLFNAFSNFISRLKHLINRCREEGFRGSLRLMNIRIRGKYKKKYLPIKYKYGFHKKCLNDVLRKSIVRQITTKGGKPSSVADIDTDLNKLLISYFDNRQSPGFFIKAEHKADIIATLKRNFPEEVKKTLEIADMICQHRFNWLTPNCPKFDDKILWTGNFADSRVWPMDFYFDLDYSSEKRLGDVREVWELNRHQFFVVLGKAYWISEEERYAKEFVQQITDWIESNPVGYGINWLHSQEAAIRAVAWIWSYYFFKDYKGFDVPKKQLFLRSIYEHADYISWNLSNGPVTHNHLISEVCGLAIIGIMFPEFKKAEKWRKEGIRIFEREVVKQVWEDGLDGELSTNYHCFVLDSFLQLSLLMKINNIEPSGMVMQRIEKMIEAVMHLVRPDGSLPWIGDCDGGRAYRLSEYNGWDRRSYLSIGAVLFGRGDFKKVAKKFHEEAFWLLGANGLQAYGNLKTADPEALCSLFKHGGIATMRNSWGEDSDYIIFRGGPTRRRPGVSISHNHADFLSFELFIDQKPLFVDPGTYLYGQDDRWRFFFRQSMAHNTVVVDGMDHLNVTTTRFGIPELPLSQIHEYTFSDNYCYIDMSHSGYAECGISHRRRLLWFKGDCLVIIDKIIGAGTHNIEQYFHFDRNVTLNIRESGGIEGETPYFWLLPLFNVAGECVLLSGEESPIQGWVSPRYGERHPAPVVRYSLTQNLPVTLGRLLTTNSNAKTSVTEFALRDDSIDFELERAGRVEKISFKDHGGFQINQK